MSTPLNSITYALTVIDTNGCQAVDVVNIEVTKDRLVYIPSGFSPDGDGLNDRLTLYGGTGVAQVNYFRIFDRWGSLVYEINNRQPNIETEGWDGVLKGKELPTGVYIYIAEVVFTDGWVEQYKGDITLIR